MTPQGPGRHCAACQKTVVDFTQKTDAEILAALTQATSGTCGRFRAEQLARPLPPAVQGPGRWRAWLTAAVAVWGLREGTGVAAQAQAAVEQGLGATERKLGKVAVAADAPVAVVLKGKVTDASSHEDLPGATVWLKGTSINTAAATASDGSFKLSVPQELLSTGRFIVTISFVGFKGQQVEIVPAANMQFLEFALVPDLTQLGEPELIVLHKPWHPHRFYYWIARPFRRG